MGVVQEAVTDRVGQGRVGEVVVKLYRRTGKREQAHEHLTTATTMYREMDRRFWLPEAEAAMAELG